MVNPDVSEHHSSSKGMVESQMPDDVPAEIFLALDPSYLGACADAGAQSLSSTRLWVSIRIDFNRLSRLLDVFHLSIIHSGVRPLEVSLIFSMGRSRESVQEQDSATEIGIPLSPGPMRAWDKIPRYLARWRPQTPKPRTLRQLEARVLRVLAFLCYCHH